MWQIEYACSGFTIIGAGEVRASGTLAELRRSFPTRTLRVAPDLPEIRAVFLDRGFGVPEREPDGILRWELPAATDFGELLRAAVAAGPLESFDREEPSLNQIYVRALAATGEQAA
jgi:ABC-type uncharacterized transport system ATPase subunit